MWKVEEVVLICRFQFKNLRKKSTLDLMYYISYLIKVVELIKIQLISYLIIVGIILKIEVTPKV